MILLSLLYNCVLLLYGSLHLPFWVWQWALYGKYRSSFLARLGIGVPLAPLSSQKIIWIHTISMGETRAVIPLYEEIRKKWPEATLYVSTTTETGQKEAKRSFPQAEGIFYLPFDFSPIIQKAIKRIRPHVLILCESDFWFELLKGVRAQGGKTLLVNGKISERSEKRFAWVSFFSRRLFYQLDHLCVQNTLFAERFHALGVPERKITLTGNLKLSAKEKKLSTKEKKLRLMQFKILPQDLVVVIGSTHEGEEALLLNQLEKVWLHLPHLKVLIAPRHPERFSQVARLLENRKTHYIRYSNLPAATGAERVVLVDTVGLLPICFQLAQCAVIGGSYFQGFRGHNIFEPIQAHIPVLFGPYMDGQPELVRRILEAKAGIQSHVDELSTDLLNLFTQKQVYSRYRANAKELDAAANDATERTFQCLEQLLT